MAKGASINPNNYKESTREFSALVNVVSSRYVEIKYPQESGYASKVGVKWTMESTNGKEFSQAYSTGLAWREGIVTDDGRTLTEAPKPASDAVLLFRKAKDAGFPEELLSDDVSVFDGHAFFVANSNNSEWRGSSKKPYPVEYYPEGFETAKAARARKANPGFAIVQELMSEASSSSHSFYPPVVITDPTSVAARDALTAILTENGGKVTRWEIPSKLASLPQSKQWDKETRQTIALALFDLPSLSKIVEGMPLAVMQGDVISIK